MIKLRDTQREILAYTKGRMGIAAVPGSGKTFTLSLIAARLVKESNLNDDQEILIVTLVNSAVDHFNQRVASILKNEYGLLPDLGYRVRTLHGLAHDILHERPDLAGLPDKFTILDNQLSLSILKDIAAVWIKSHPDFIDRYGITQDDQKGRRYSDWQDYLTDLGLAFIRQAKDLDVSPSRIRQLLEEANWDNPLLEAGLSIYTEYQRTLNFRSAVDFDDLIRMAMRTLQSDPDYLATLHYRWPYVLEDEAQDSSRLQELILNQITGPDGNWIRVGDTNQAIYETFTTANPKYLKEFLQSPSVVSQTLPISGRSTNSIINITNRLINWTREEHPIQECRDALNPPFILPTPPGDPQPNPNDNQAGIHLISRGYSAEKEIEMVVQSIQKWLPNHQEESVAILVPRNSRATQIADALRAKGIPCKDFSGAGSPARSIATIISQALICIHEPSAVVKLTSLWEVLGDLWEIKDTPLSSLCKKALHQLDKPEDFFSPLQGNNWETLFTFDSEFEKKALYHLGIFREFLCKWHKASLLSIDQLILTIGQDLYRKPSDLAMVHNIARTLEHAAGLNPLWRIPEFISETQEIASSYRHFQGFFEEEDDLDPDEHRGEVLIATIHKAKGLEWDRVYLVSLSNYDFPSALPGDQFISEKWFVRDRLNLIAEMVDQLNALVTNDIELYQLAEGAATLSSRYMYASERLRLLYVGITRAKKELIMTWNTGRDGKNKIAVPFSALINFLENKE